jgi:hypothetical protein
VHQHGVTFADEAEQCPQLRPMRILARRVIGEQPVQCDAVELSIDILVEAADTDVADPLTADVCLPLEVSG